MDAAITSALAAVMGASVGGLASLGSTWLGERSRSRRDLLQREIGKRESTYSEFIERAFHLFAASATHSIEDDVAEVAGLASLYAVSSRIRLFASDGVILEADKVVDRIIAQYGDENISAEQLRTSALERKEDPLKEFSITCRRELQDIQRAM
jgi:hypothetical protein